MPDDRSEMETALIGAGTQPAGSRVSKPGFEPGTRVGDYEILNPIGAGGMGEVYRVRNVISDRTEAMKVLLPSLTQEPSLAQRFTREIKVQATMQHPNIAGLHTAFHFKDQLVMIMEYVDGMPLDERLRQGNIPLTDCLAYVIQVLRALSYAHGRGITHRDIKPANIMVLPDGTVKLMDFGIANVAKDPKLTGTGITVGSPYYMSPEQIRGESPDPRSDIYSLGITLYELVTGRRPINGDSQFSIMAAHLNDIPTPPIALDNTLPAGLNEIILMSIAKQPEQRFQTADAFLNALESVRGGLASAAPPMTAIKSAPVLVSSPPPPRVPVGASMPASAPPKSHRGVYMGLGAIAAIAVLALAAFEIPKYLKTSARDAAPPDIVAAPVSGTPVPAAQPIPAPVVSAPAAVPVAEAPQARPTVPATATPARTNPVPRPEVLTQAQHADTRNHPGAVVGGADYPPQHPPSSTPVPAVTVPATPAATAPAAPAVSTAELQKLEDRMAHLSSRVSSLDHTLQRMEQSQNASGLGMRSDFVQSRDMMHSFFGQAEAALRNQDVAAGARYLDRAEIQADKLAKALNQ
ncbi:MAG: serine/threonine protein kinase [Acidobacteriota bacterium]|nr:serine/threonine protein kinase [Acidobacteriota bacterium]